MLHHDFTKKLLAWHKTIHRPMPWKGEKNPYLIWLSEIILQQTRVEQGWAYYLKFKERFPVLKNLANASEDEVLKLWQGLGYNTRTRNLHVAAKSIQHDLKGKFPTDYEGIRNLKGIGDYTAAAIASFAFNLPYVVVDANVFRVLSRYFGIITAIDSTKGKQQFKALAEQLLSKKEPAKFNQAIMDFGAVQCVPKNPDCGKCALSSNCVARKKKQVENLPVKSKKTKQRERFFHYLVILEGDFTYLKKREAKDIWQGMFEFPLIEGKRLLEKRQLLQTKEFKSLFSQNKIRKIELHASLRQMLSHQKIHAAFYEVTLSSKMKNQKFLRVANREINGFAFPGIIRDYLTTR
ncbi:MAG: A/G-specific adenine glycosylase [Chitinophagales bacterium]|nr:A/G-specific adenine glycosylase [Chitinophagales bacterium]